MQQGVSLYLTIVILSVLIAALLTLVTISVSQIKVIWAIGDSVAAFYAADTGVEHCLYRIRKEKNFDNFSEDLNEISYQVSITVFPSETVINSIGNYKKTKTKRAIEAVY